CVGHAPGEIYVVGKKYNPANHLYDIQVLYKSTDFGKTVEIIENNSNISIYRDETEGGFYKNDIALLYSNDNCESWQYISSSVPYFSSGARPNQVWSGWRTISFNNGEDWIENSGDGIGKSYTNIFTPTVVEGEAFICPYNRKLYKTEDYGELYSCVDTLDFIDNDWGLKLIRGTSPGELYILLPVDRKLFYKSDYNSDFELHHTFDYIDSSILTNNYEITPGYSDGEIYLVYSNVRDMGLNYTLHVYYSSDYGESFRYFTPVNSDSTSIIDNCITIKHPLQIYPNPFNPVTTIKYKLSKASNLDINLYNIKGEKIKTIYDGYKEEGIYSIVFDGTKLISGLYFVKIKTKDSIIVEKCLLIK
ncbi:MAG TPA: T9SS type A sorting domain-containing protein, partial [Bacilli bacterium]|nr:T9SS type A sorting domain-containing protein [Bacilli bacterium]